MSRRFARRRISRPDRSTVPPAIEARLRKAEAGGRALDAANRSRFEARTGELLGEVRLHDDAASADVAQAIGARAFTFGRHVFLGPQAHERGEGRLIPHELAHVVQSGGVAGPIRRQAAPVAPARPRRVTFNFAGPIPLPPRGTRTLQATADVPGISWSLGTDTVAPAPGTAISATGVISIAAAQTAGTIKVIATNNAGDFVEQPLQFSGTPTGIESSSPVREPADAHVYGHVFDHVFTSSTGNVADLQDVAVGESFPGLANPTGATHAIPPPLYPFGGTFTLATATLTANASNNWFVTAAGGLNGTLDTVSIGHDAIDVGRFVQSASNPTPAGRLPRGFTIDQHLHWYNPLVVDAAQRWTHFATVGHSRFLTNIAGTLALETTVNGMPDGGDAYVGAPAVTNLNAIPINTPRSVAARPGGGGAPARRTVSLSVDTLPAPLPTGKALRWSIRGAALGCTVAVDPADPTRAVLTIGTSAGTVTIRIADAGGTNFDEIAVRIT